VSAPALADVMDALPEAMACLLRSVLELAETRGVAIYLVGGPVRDLLLERPVLDVDLLVEPGEGHSVQSLADAAAPDGAEVTAHDRFGTVTIRSDQAAIDLATVRKESYAHDGALPTVSEGTLEEDLQRRDFTVNALAFPLTEKARARHSGIVDVERGVDDLASRKLRVLHRRSFHDDPTRALRAARLAPRLGFSLSRGSRSALRDALRDGAFGRVSGDRLRREIVKLFEDARYGVDPTRALKLLSKWQVLGALEPELSMPQEAAFPLRRVGRCVERPPWRAGRWRPWVTGLGVWLAPLAPQLRRRTLRRFAVRGGLLERMVEMARTRQRNLRALEKARGRGAIDAVLRAMAEEELFAHYAWAAPAVRRRITRYAAEDRQRRLPVSGSDLTAIGLSGPAVGRALARVRSAFLDGVVRNREEALALAREVGRHKGARGGAGKRAARAGDRRRRRPGSARGE
jgi:tRNA nucleotidyltransferase (CCA-adding enzyme)